MLREDSAQQLRKRSIADALAPLNELAESSPHFLSKSFGDFEAAGRNYSLPRYVYLGPKGGGDTLRLGIFAGVHGDEPEGTLAIARFVAALEQNRDIAKGYALFLYPVCNPTGFEENTRYSRSGKDLNREFWKDSIEPEVTFLETEIWTHAFHGLINLHSDNTSEGLYGFVNGTILSEYLLEPALNAAERFLPRNHDGEIDGFRARKGIIYQGYQGVLRAVPGLTPPPFELTLETPRTASLYRQIEATNASLQVILTEFRKIISIGQNI